MEILRSAVVAGFVCRKAVMAIYIHIYLYVVSISDRMVEISMIG